MSFEEKKEATLKKLQYYLEEKEVDPPIIPLLEIINSHPGLFTTSSCSGRVMVLIDRGRKVDSEKYLTFHRTISLEDLQDLPKEGWLRVEPFILHIMAKDWELALDVVDLVKEIGVKRSGVSRARVGYLIEMMGNVYMSAPLSHLTIDEDLISIINQKMEKNFEVLKKVEEAFKRWIEESRRRK
ncbi:MAG: hypothetical protein GXN92_02460 [Candidatus Micrarchaeota archaeon]|nr:hypothetical protein [Candidatus Micrarchaeota archaeon]